MGGIHAKKHNDFADTLTTETCNPQAVAARLLQLMMLQRRQITLGKRLRVVQASLRQTASRGDDTGEKTQGVVQGLPTLLHSALLYSDVVYSTVICSTLLCSSLLQRRPLYCTTLFGMVLRCTGKYSKMPVRQQLPRATSGSKKSSAAQRANFPPLGVDLLTLAQACKGSSRPPPLQE